MPPSPGSPSLDISSLIDRHWQRIYKLCLFYLRDKGDAEDAAQAAFEKVLKKSGQFQGQADPYTWIYRIAVNTAINMLRRRRIVRFLSLSAAGGREPQAEDDPAAALEAGDEMRLKRQQLAAGIENLSAREKTAFFLFYYERRPQKEIAQIMKSSLPAVEALVHKAIKKIRKGWQGPPGPDVKGAEHEP